MSTPGPLDALVSPRTADFERALVVLRERTGGAAEPPTLVMAALSQLDQATVLPARERCRRMGLVLKLVPPAAEAYEALAAAARGMSNEGRNAVVVALPPEFRKSVFASGAKGSDTPGQLDAELRPTSGAPPAAEPPAPPSPEGAPERVVLLLGSADEHEANRATLGSHNFTHLRAGTPEELARLWSPQLCGIVVARGWWSAVPRQHHEATLRHLVSRSDLVWLKIDVTGLAEPLGTNLLDICKEIRFDEAACREVALTSEARLTSTDLNSLEHAADLLGRSREVSIHLSDLAEADAQVLMAAVARHVQARHHARVELSRLGASVMQGGRGSARLVLVKPNDGGAPLVAKVDGAEGLRGEMRRFKEFIAPWDTLLRPRLHVHGERSAMVFALVDDASSADSPAPMLEKQLAGLMRAESGMPHAVSEEALRRIIQAAAQKLARLNIRTASTDIPVWAWLGLDTLEAMITAGVQWSVLTLDGQSNALAIRQDVLGIAKRLEGRATVHGDPNLRNILVRGGHEPCFIDYAFSGPGHPAFDLAYLESALWFECFRMVSEEARIAQLVRAVCVEGRSFEAAADEFPALMSSASNRLAVFGSVLCRRLALEVLAGYDGELVDYLAVRYVLACHALSFPHAQTGVVRASIQGLADELALAVQGSVQGAGKLPQP